jgi:hypothetical protein
MDEPKEKEFYKIKQNIKMKNSLKIKCEESNMLYVPIKDTNLIRLGELIFESEEYLERYKKCNRSLNEAALELGTSTAKLINFLRKHELLCEIHEDDIEEQYIEPQPEYIMMGYFLQGYYDEHYRFHKVFNDVTVTPKGMEAIKQLIKLLNPSQL